MPVSAPKNGIVVDAPQSRAGLRSTKCSASVSPGSAPSTWNGPVCGLTSVMSSTSDGRSVGRRSAPENASSVHNRSTVPGAIRCIGATPPKVHAYWLGLGAELHDVHAAIVADASRYAGTAAPGGTPLMHIAVRRCTG